MRTIDADALQEEYKKYHDGALSPLISLAPTVEPQRMQGRWIRSDDNPDGKYWECSVCHDEFIAAEDTINNFHFCPTCGAQIGQGGDD